MFSYTDDAIVTSSPTGRHLSTVIRRPPAIGPLDWNEHADQVCKVLNELKASDALIDAGKIASDYQSRSWTQYARLRAFGHPEILAELRSSGPYMADLERRFGQVRPFEDQPPRATEARQPMPSADPQREENVFLRGEVERLKRVLAAEQMPVELPIETAALRVLLENVGTGSLLHCKAPCGRTVIIKRVE